MVIVALDGPKRWEIDGFFDRRVQTPKSKVAIGAVVKEAPNKWRRL
jgi:hypothetical protein